MNRLVLSGAFLLALSAGCATTNPPECAQALVLREQAEKLSGEQRAVLEAQAAGLEAVCAQKRQDLWNRQKEYEQRTHRR